MPKSNVRFVAIWAALVPVLTYAVMLVPALHIAAWSQGQVNFAIATVNAGSALVLAAVAFFWARSVKEPAALQGALTVFVLAVVALGNVFHWWNLDDTTGQLVAFFAVSLFVVGGTAFVRWAVFAPETVEIEKAKAVTPAAVIAAMPEKLRPPSTPVPSAPESGQVSWLMLLVVVAVVVLIIAVFWGWRP